jgi:hypothetical protein
MASSSPHTYVSFLQQFTLAIAHQNKQFHRLAEMLFIPLKFGTVEFRHYAHTGFYRNRLQQPLQA